MAKEAYYCKCNRSSPQIESIAVCESACMWSSHRALPIYTVCSCRLTYCFCEALVLCRGTLSDVNPSAICQPMSPGHGIFVYIFGRSNACLWPAKQGKLRLPVPAEMSLTLIRGHIYVYQPVLTRIVLFSNPPRIDLLESPLRWS